MNKQFISMKRFIVNEEDNTIFLMKKGSKDKLNIDKWQVPGGKIEFGEAPTDALKREVKEECGLEIEVGNLYIKPWTWIHTKEDGNQSQVVAIGQLCKPLTTKVDFSNQTETDDLVDSQWVPIDKVLEYDLTVDLIPSMEEFVSIYFKFKNLNLSIFDIAK